MATQAPQYKLAKVGQNREKKRGGIAAWFRSLTGRGGLSGMGGAGAGAGAAGGVGGAGGFALTSGMKALITIIAALVSLSAYGIGHHLSVAGSGSYAGRKKLFDSKGGGSSKYDGDVSKLPKSGARGSGLDMIAGGMGEDKTEAGAAADAAAKADAAGAGGAADAAAKAPGAGIDPAALAAAAAAKAQGGGDADKTKKGGAAGFSSGLGGMGKIGATGSAGGGPALAASTPKGTLGGAFAASNTPAKSAASLSPKGLTRGVHGLAGNQLIAAKNLSGLARTQSGDASATTASTPFDANPGAAQSIGGAGASLGGPSGVGGGGDVGPGPGSGAGGQPYVGGGSIAPGGTNPDDCGSLFPGQNYTNNSNGACVTPVTPTNTTPWQSLVDMAGAMLIIAAVCLTIASVLGFVAKGGITSSVWAAAQMFAKIAAACAAIATLCGVGVLLMGGSDKLQGGLITGLGGLVTVCAAIVAFMPEDASSTAQSAAGVIAGVGAVAGGIIGGGAVAHSGTLGFDDSPDHLKKLADDYSAAQ